MNKSKTCRSVSLGHVLFSAVHGASKIRIRQDQSGFYMKTVFFRSVLLAATVVSGFSQSSPHSESRHLAFACRDVAEIAEAYLSEHGILTNEKTSFQDISIVGRELKPVTAGSIRELTNGRKLKQWTDAQGNEITDSKVYSTYADKGTGEKLPFGVWRLRSAHYQPQGEIKLTSDDGGCKVDFRLTFGTWGANVIGILRELPARLRKSGRNAARG
jgi:hypothetical protein